MGVGDGDHVGKHGFGVVGGELGVEHGEQDVFFFVEVQDEDGGEAVELGSQLLDLVGGSWTGVHGSHEVARASMRRTISTWSAFMVSVAPGAPMACSTRG